MNNEITADNSSDPERSWAQVHIPTFRRAARGLQRGIAAIPQLPKPVATVLLALIAIIGLLAILLLIGTDLAISVRP